MSLDLKNLTDAQKILIRSAIALCETVEECHRDGPVPEGTCYLAFQSAGMSLEAFQQVKSLALQSGRIQHGPGTNTLVPRSAVYSARHSEGTPEDKASGWKRASAKTAVEMLQRDDDGTTPLTEVQRRKFLEIAGDKYPPKKPRKAKPANPYKRGKAESEADYLARIRAMFLKDDGSA